MVVMMLALFWIRCWVLPMVPFFGPSFSMSCRAASVDTRYAITPTTPPTAIAICNAIRGVI
ncbi:hypothetical protein DPMN_050508 [Dreissena polymorpha]|uniref:Secreted peptide n=1 Tax=Dreissena polymorpha TaxID=45954 RepID=A0A9D4CI00_DREPO|nr:hypothetical protein DPMN_050508 [Dreissena polymorpha]